MIKALFCFLNFCSQLINFSRQFSFFSPQGPMQINNLVWLEYPEQKRYHNNEKEGFAGIEEIKFLLNNDDMLISHNQLAISLPADHY